MAKILFVSGKSTLSMGGQKSTLLLMDGLKARHDIVLCVPAEGDFSKEAASRNIPSLVQTLPCLKTLRIWRILLTVERLRRILKRWRIELIHCESPRALLYFGLAARALKIPIVWHVRVCDPENRWYEHFLYNLADKIIAVSDAAAERFRRFAGNKVEKIYNAVNFPEPAQASSSAFRSEFRIAGDVPLVGLVGRVTAFKGQDDLIAAAPLILKVVPSVKFVLAGDAEDEERRRLNQRIAAEGLGSAFILTGHRNDIEHVIEGLDILVSASHMEGFSRAVIEAMALGKPVVATAVGGNVEAVMHEQTGLLVPAQNPRELAQAIVTLLKAPDLARRYGEAARQRVREHFTLDTQLTKVEAIYARLLRI